MKTAVIIARFQTPYLHEGHRQLISQVKTNHAKLIIVLGISPIVGSRKNPYDYYTREKQALEGAGRPGNLFRFNEAKYFQLIKQGINFEI